MKKLLVVLVIGSVGCLAYGGGQSPEPAFGPYPIEGLDGYGYVVAGHTEDEQLLMQLVRTSEDTTAAEYLVVDSFSCIEGPEPCGGTSISYVTQEDSCFHIITLGPLPNTKRDTVVSSCINSRYWTMGQHFLVKEKALFAYVVNIPRGDRVKNAECIIGRVGDNRLIDTLALIRGGAGCRLLPDSTEVFVGVIFDTDQYNAPRMTVGIYDLAVDSLLMPLHTTYDTWAGYRLSRDKPLYYIKRHPVHGTNVWRWDPDWGEELVTFFPKPDVVRGFELTADSLICFVGMETDSASTGVTRVAVPIDAE